MGNLLIEVHALETMLPSLMNRGENNEAKTVRIGDVTRARISSQSMKYAMSIDDNGKRDFIATKNAQMLINKMIDEDESISNKDELKKFFSEIKFEVSKTENSKIEDSILGERNARTITRYTKGEMKDIYIGIIDAYNAFSKSNMNDKTNYANMVKEYVDANIMQRRMEESIAIWGRFTAVKKSIIGYTNDSAVHMSHAISIDAFQSDSDFFAAVDSVKTEMSEGGAGMLDTTDICGNTMYKYMNVSPVIALENMRTGLIQGYELSNLADALVDVVISFITVKPVAKQHSNASYERPAVVYVTTGKVAPCTMGSRFHKAIKADRKSVMEQGLDKFIDHIKDDAYSLDDEGYKSRYAIIISEFDDYKSKFNEAGVSTVNLKTLKEKLKNDIMEELERLS